MAVNIMGSLQCIPKFALQGYADYGDRSITIPWTGETIAKDNYIGLDFIGIKPNAPKWAKDEYEQWQKTKAEALKTNTKL